MKCSEYRKILTSMLARRSKEKAMERTDTASHTNYRFLSTPEKAERLHQLQRKTKVCKQKIQRMEVRLEKALERRGIQVDSAFHDDLCSTMEEKNVYVLDKYPPNSFPRIFWEQQHRASQLKDSRSMKWEPAMIR